MSNSTIGLVAAGLVIAVLLLVTLGLGVGLVVALHQPPACPNCGPDRPYYPDDPAPSPRPKPQPEPPCPGPGPCPPRPHGPFGPGDCL